MYFIPDFGDFSSFIEENKFLFLLFNLKRQFSKHGKLLKYTYMHITAGIFLGTLKLYTFI